MGVPTGGQGLPDRLWHWRRYGDFRQVENRRGLDLKVEPMAALVGYSTGHPTVTFNSPPTYRYASKVFGNLNHWLKYTLIFNYGSYVDPVFSGSSECGYCMMEGNPIETSRHLGQVCIWFDDPPYPSTSNPWRIQRLVKQMEVPYCQPIFWDRDYRCNGPEIQPRPRFW